MKKQLFLLIFFLGLITFGYSQTEKLVDEAEDFISVGKYNDASGIYKNLLVKNPENPEYNFRYGLCLLNTTKGVFESVQYLEKAVSVYKNTNNTSGLFLDAYYTLGKAYHINYMFDQAIEAFTDLKKYSDDEFLHETADKDIKTSEYALQLFMEPKELVVSKLGIINSKYSDHSPVISGDESILIFTSKRENSTGGLLTPEGGYYEDVYVYDRTKGIDAKPENIGYPINTDKHEATCGLSIDGQMMFLYRSKGEHDGNIYFSKLKGDKWSVPEMLSSNINSKYRETHATISADGNSLYFTSNRKDGFGGYDIYVSNKKTDGTWGKSKNLGSTINTSGNEEGPYIHADGKTLYFSSNGLQGMGGYDIFYSIKDSEDNWSKPENMGFPLNTVGNDVYYVPTADGKKGYYASEIGGVSDIYIAQLYSEKEKSLSMVSGFVQDRKKIIIDTFLLSDCNIKGDTITSPNKKITLSNHTYFNKDSVLIRSRKINDNKITITDSTFKIPENASIYVIDADTKILENSYSPNSFTGKYIFVLNSAKNYKIYFEAKGYIFDTRDIKALKSKKYQNISYNSKLDTLIKGNVKKTKKIGFEPGLTTINSFSVLELEILSLFLKKNEDLYLNISGYDYLFDESNRNYFPLEYEYAQERKRKLINYLQDKGINPRRIYTDMFPANIIGDSLEYTVFNEKTLKEAVALKEERKEIFVNVLENANKTEEQIYAEYGLDSLSQEKIFIVNDIQFEINQYKINGQEENINSFAEYLKQNKDVIVQIGGFTDEQGLKSYNYDLARKRAETVKAELIKKGVNKNQLKTKIYADENPIALNRGEDGEFLWESLKYNRRVEFKVLNQTGKDNLIVKNINVPDQFKISKIKASENKTFAISLLISDTPQNLDDFSNLTDVKEKQYSDGTFMYFYGDFKDNDQVLNELSKVKTKFPDAFIFVKNF